MGVPPVGAATPTATATLGQPLFSVVWHDDLREFVRSILREELIPLLATVKVERSPDDWMTVEDIAAATKLDPETIYRWVRSGKLHAHKAGRLVRVKRSDFEAAFRASPGQSLTADEMNSKVNDIIARRKTRGA